jgi:hypothetical protein
LVLPTALAFGGTFALLAEAVMVAPSLDPYGVVNPLDQYIFALGIAFTASIFIHHAYETMHDEEANTVRRWVAYLFGAGTVIALTYFGIVRGRQIAFAAELSQNPVGAFLGRYLTITSIVFVCLTLGFPIAAAVAITNGLERIRNWKQFNSARRAFDFVVKELPSTKRQLEAEKEKLVHQLKSLDEKRKRWRHDYFVYHEKGVISGTRQTAIWMVWLKALAVATTVFCLAWGCSHNWRYLAVPAFLISWVCFYHDRVHPTPAQQFSHQNIKFRDPEEASQPANSMSADGQKEQFAGGQR